MNFDQFYHLSWDGIYRPLALTFRDVDLAREAVDEAMARAFARWSRIAELSNPSGWVYRVAYRWAIDQMRQRSTEQRILPRLFTRGWSLPEVEPQLADALAGLSEEQRAVVILAHAFDWSEREIAQVLGIPAGTVKSRLHRGMAVLREEIGT